MLDMLLLVRVLCLLLRSLLLLLLLLLGSALLGPVDLLIGHKDKGLLK